MADMGTNRKSPPRLTVLEAKEALAAAIKRQEDSLRKKNAAFERMTPARKRITIARDVLEQLAMKRIIATQGAYLQVPRRVEEMFGKDSDSGVPVHEALMGVPCQACGIGSLFVAAVDRHDKCNTDEMDEANDSSFMRDYLGRFFDREQLVLIETAFEGSFITPAGTYMQPWHEQVDRALDFNVGIKSSKARLRRIMENIVKHRGEFVP